MISIVAFTILLFILFTAISTLLLRDVLGSIIAFASYSLGMSILWLLLEAPDVALIEAAVGAGMTTVLFLLAITKTVRPRGDDIFIEKVDWKSLIIVALFIVLLLSTVPSFPEIGDPTAPSYAYEDVTQYYLENAYKQTGVSNVVTAVLAAYRGFDTLGEAVVVFTSGVAILIALKEERFT